MGSGFGKAGYSAYKVVIADTAAGGPLYPRPGSNDNVLGAPNQIRTQTDPNTPATDFNQVNAPTLGGPPSPSGMGVSPGQYFLVGAPLPDATSTIKPARVPATTPLVQSANMQYQLSWNGVTGKWTDPKTGTSGITDLPTPPPLGASTGVTVLLRRLANPYIPYNALTNPYITADYMEAVTPNPTIDAMGMQRTYASRGKLQPYASDFATQVRDQAPVGGSTSAHTLGIQNNAVGGNPASFNWLVHLDRKPISPVELTQVSGFHPHQLTHQFINPASPSAVPASGGLYGHRVDWFNPANRLHRLFEFLATDGRSSGVWAGDKIPGKINLNTIWDVETFRAICDAQPGNSFYGGAGTPNQVVDGIYNQMMNTRTPGGAPGAADRPFKSLAAAPWGGPSDPQYPGSAGIDDTFFRAGGAGRLFEVPPGTAGGLHPYMANQLMTKIFNNVTTRSNTFAVWLTIGFFEVIQDSDPVTGQPIYPVKLGAEINLATGRNIRHHMFAVVDRSAMNLEVAVGKSNNGVNAGTGVPPQNVTGVQLNGPVQLANGTTVPYQIQAGTILVVDWGTPSEEMVVVTQTQTAGPNSFQANFTRPHSPGFAITLAGNPGPQQQFDFRNQKYTSTVPLVVPID